MALGRIVKDCYRDYSHYLAKKVMFATFRLPSRVSFNHNTQLWLWLGITIGFGLTLLLGGRLGSLNEDIGLPPLLDLTLMVVITD